MSTLNDLPSETLLQIIGLLKNPNDVFDLDQENGPPSPHRRSTLATVAPISLANKRMNAVCNDIIFQTYRVSLHRSLEDNTPGSLAHAMGKRHSIRKLVLQHGKRWAHHEDGTLYSPDVLDRLLQLAQAVSQQVNVLVIRDTQGDVKGFNLAVWEIFLAMPLRIVSISNVAIPQELPSTGVIEVDTLRMSISDKTKHLLDRFRPRFVDLTYPYSLFKNHTIEPYKPTDDRLESIKLSYCVSSVAPPGSPLLDFTNVPQAKIHLKLWSDVKLRMHILSAWQTARELIPKLVVDLDRFDVTRYRHDRTATVTRPSLLTEPDFEPTRDDHIPSEDDDEREEALMNASYSLR